MSKKQSKTKAPNKPQSNIKTPTTLPSDDFKTEAELKTAYDELYAKYSLLELESEQRKSDTSVNSEVTIVSDTTTQMEQQLRVITERNVELERENVTLTSVLNKIVNERSQIKSSIEKQVAQLTSREEALKKQIQENNDKVADLHDNINWKTKYEQLCRILKEKGLENVDDVKADDIYKLLLSTREERDKVLLKHAASLSAHSIPGNKLNEKVDSIRSYLSTLENARSYGTIMKANSKNISSFTPTTSHFNLQNMSDEDKEKLRSEFKNLVNPTGANTNPTEEKSLTFNDYQLMYRDLAELVPQKMAKDLEEHNNQIKHIKSQIEHSINAMHGEGNIDKST